ncbi:hypothetical protein EDD85DRAFT_950465 [Armillaria nabsnona]|nr:hypothetical protein EDD85DRAFT_950465 [Armillaria nabsnona]
MSQTILPHRGWCIQMTDGTSIACHCPWFNAPSLPLSDQLSCVECRHGVHAYGDYESKIVFHNPTTHCAAYAQRTHQSQACSCTVQLFDPEPTVNAFVQSLCLTVRLSSRVVSLLITPTHLEPPFPFIPAASSVSPRAMLTFSSLTSNQMMRPWSMTQPAPPPSTMLLRAIMITKDIHLGWMVHHLQARTLPTSPIVHLDYDA